MLVTWKYRPRNTFIQRLDPRTRFILLLCTILALTIPEIWDYRILVPLFLFSLTQFLMARIEWRDIRRPLFFIFILVFFIVGLNGLLSGRGGPSSVNDPNSPILFQALIPGTTWGLTVTISKLWFAMSQIIRILTMALPAILIPYTIDPNIYGTTFKQLKASDKVAFTIDLAFRFLPTFARDLTITMDAQRARGYEMDKLKGGVAAKISKLAPLVIPVTMQSTVTGEEVIDAMDLRAFGTNPRTWLKKLEYQSRDYFVISLGVAIFLACCILKWGFGIGDFFVPDFFTKALLG
ncbi:MAG TPA: energy-coupling factor transporter transmembrane component T [Anaerolineales bacterium]|nr:energy-coupling factor transporter transmembrane component T [Anaerolineales bacterium]